MNQNRRKFIKTSAAATSAMFLSSFEKMAASGQPSFTVNKNFELVILATNWGYDGSYESFFSKIKKEGYDGAEIWCPGTDNERKELSAAAQKNGMKLGLLFGAGETQPLQNLDNFKKTLQAAASMNPIYINCHTGRDFFSFDQLKPFFDFTIQLSKQTGISIYHETHRGRALYSAPVTRNFIEKIPALRITADLSHWCAVHESLLEDQAETMEIVLNHTDHIHARIGHAEGPQVSDPRAPEWEYAVKTHLGWWDKVAEQKKKIGARLTILTEFGPPDYMWTLPYTRQPLADQWAINVHMMNILRKRYA
jgi:sugar phosphate isomerase/epimerase